MHLFTYLRFLFDNILVADTSQEQHTVGKLQEKAAFLLDAQGILLPGEYSSEVFANFMKSFFCKLHEQIKKTPPNNQITMKNNNPKTRKGCFLFLFLFLFLPNMFVQEC